MNEIIEKINKTLEKLRKKIISEDSVSEGEYREITDAINEIRGIMEKLPIDTQTKETLLQNINNVIEELKSKMGKP